MAFESKILPYCLFVQCSYTITERFLAPCLLESYMAYKSIDNTKIFYLFSRKEWYSHSLFRIITVKDTQDGEWTKKRGWT